ncbi:MAG TPA: SHOCT domain-containing protein [Symbiobacteriaceae bacterium]|jgi:uncharacterized membrane protein
MMLMWIVPVLLIVFLFDRVTPRRTEHEPGDEALATLRLRLARGEISVEEYESLRKRIQA